MARMVPPVVVSRASRTAPLLLWPPPFVLLYLGLVFSVRADLLRLYEAVVARLAAALALGAAAQALLCRRLLAAALVAALDHLGKGPR
jgi:ABC-type microcin C transport system permease subunit YejE